MLLIPGLVTSATCVGINRCPGIVNNPQAPATHVVPCGFTDDSDNVLMVCCPTEMVKEVTSTVQEPRFPGNDIVLASFPLIPLISRQEWASPGL